MAQASGGGGSEWDIDWDYTKGLPGDNGYTKETSGTTSETLNDDSLYLTANGSSAYVRYVISQHYSKAVLEVEFKTGSVNNHYFRFSVSQDGVEGIGVQARYSASYKGIYLNDNSSLSSCTKLKTISLNHKYTIKLVLNDGYGDVYIDGALVAEHEPIHETWGTMTMASFNATSTTTFNGTFYSIKMKLGRT